MRRGNDVNPQYRSAIFVADEAQRKAAKEIRSAFARCLITAGYPPITTTIGGDAPFY